MQKLTAQNMHAVIFIIFSNWGSLGQTSLNVWVLDCVHLRLLPAASLRGLHDPAQTCSSSTDCDASVWVSRLPSSCQWAL